jgi:CheY-like chemotaxis protein
VQALARQFGPAGRVLVVDDYADARANLRDLLEEYGLEVVEAADGQQAFDFLVEQSELDVRLILLDLDMPRMTGWEFLKLLKSYVRFSSIPVIVVSRHTAYLRPRDHRLLLGCLESPASVAELRGLIETIVRH